MNKLHRFVLAGLLTTATSLLAQPGPDGAPRGPRRGPPGGPGGFGGHGLPPILLALDADKNGELSSAEIANAPISLKHLDLNDDGIYTIEELRPFRPARPADAPARPVGAPVRGAHARPQLPVMLALDANADGVISAPEIANAVASLKALDANGDGMLTHDELRPLSPAGK